MIMTNQDHALSKVPEVVLGFWIIKILATTLGEVGGDAVTMSMNLGYLVGTCIFAAIFAITMNVADGARAVPREYLEVARSFRSAKTRTLFDIVLPASTPYLLAGFRLAAGRALIGAVVAEFFLSIGGLGFYILYNSRSYHHNEAFVGVLLLAAFGVGFEVLVQWATRRFMPWYRRGEK